MPYTANTLKKQYKKACLEQRKKNLVKLREKIAGLTPTEFSKQTGIQKSNLSCLESGDRDMSLFNIQVYKTYFLEHHKLDVSTDYLLGYTSVISNTGMDISNDLGLSGESIELLKIWNRSKNNPMDGATSYGGFDIDILNLLLEDYYTAYKNAQDDGNFTNYSIFHFIGNYIFSERFKKCPENIVKYIHKSNNQETSNHLSRLNLGDIVVSKDESKTILELKTYDKYNSGEDTDDFHIYNTENEDEAYGVKFQDVMNAYNKENITSIIDRIKKRILQNKSSK